MMRPRLAPASLLLAGVVLSAGAALASNGLNMIGYGAESSLMAGADVAVARDAAALNTNPAGLAQLRTRALDMYSGTAHALDVSHADRFGNDRSVSNRFVHLGGFGYAAPWAGSAVVVGVGAFAQGGAGAVFKDLTTPFGTQDELSSLFGAFKPTVGAAWRVGDRLAVGASASAFIGALKQKIFPETSVSFADDPARSFFGQSVKNAYGVGVGAKVGVLYEVSPALAVGATYTHKTPLTLKRGDLTVNMSAVGLGEVVYDEVRMEGLGFPRQVGGGMALRPAPAWTVAFKVEWLDWSDAVKTSTLRAASPSHPGAPAELLFRQRLDWRDQAVLAAGLAYRLDEETTIRAGFNHARNPVPRHTTNPLLNAIGEKHVTLGFSRRIWGNYEMHTGIEYLFRSQVRYFNPELPFGPDAIVRNQHVALHTMLSRRW